MDEEALVLASRHVGYARVGRGFSPAGLIVAALAVLIGLAADRAAWGAAGPMAYLGQTPPGELVPGADAFGPPQGDPPMLPALKGGETVGWVILNTDFAGATGYSGKPIRILVGLSPDGRVTGARLVEHKEPIVLIGIPEAEIREVIRDLVGRPADAIATAVRDGEVDIVSGATVTVMVIADSIANAAARAAAAIAAGPGAAAAVPAAVRTVDPDVPAPEEWEDLLGEGSVRRLSLSVGEVSEAFAQAGQAEAARRPEARDPEAAFIDLYVGLVSVPAIGRSLLGERGWEALARRLEPGQHAVLVGGAGLYSFKGSGYVRGGIFDRIELIQGGETIRFRDRQHRRIADLAAEEAPRLKEIGIFQIPADARFDPTGPWRLQLLVQRAVGAREKAFLAFDLGYRLPDRYVREAAPPPAPAAAAAPQATAATGEPLWQRMWRLNVVPLGVLTGSLVLLTGIYFFQHPLVRRERLFNAIRAAFLAFTLLWIGWIAQAQLSVVNVLTFTNALVTGFSWEGFLLAPLIFVLWCAVAAALLFWGRGPFCGWLCPFGALQEFVNKGAKRLKIPQYNVPWSLHERLWPIKYIIFLVLFGVSLYSLAFAEQLSEVEPFKTAIVLRFVRDVPFVAFAVAMLAASLFIERFYCRYLCPLGAALAIPGRMRMFDWLRRYRECGNPCQRCYHECPVQAIHPEGHINPNECIGCLHCQVLYHHDRKCPVVIQRRLKREKRAALASPSMRPSSPGAGPVQPAKAPVLVSQGQSRE